MGIRAQVWLGLLLIHLGLILLVSVNETVSLIGRGSTLLRPHRGWMAVEEMTVSALGEDLDRRNPIRQAVTAYLNLAGIEGGYGFFAPNVPNNYKLVFELTYPDGRVEPALPEVASEAAGKRLASLFDHIGRAEQEDLRRVVVKMLAYSLWQQHPEAVHIRATFGMMTLPSLREFKEGKGDLYQPLSGYDFSFDPRPKR